MTLAVLNPMLLFFGTPVEHPMYHLPELHDRLEGNPGEMRFAVVNELHGVNPAQRGTAGLVLVFALKFRLLNC